MKFILSLLLVFAFTIIIAPTGACGEPLDAISITETISPDIVANINLESIVEDVNVPDIVLETYVFSSIAIINLANATPDPLRV